MSDSNNTGVAALAIQLVDQSNSLHELFNIAMNPGPSPHNNFPKIYSFILFES